jgi:SAM-dependent methyltransferase
MEHSGAWPARSGRVAKRLDRRWWAASAPLYDRLWTEPLSARLAETIVELSGAPGRRVLLAGAALPTLAGALAEAGHRVVALGRQPSPAATAGPAASRSVAARSAAARSAMARSAMARSAVTWLGDEIGDLSRLHNSVDLVVAVNVVHAQPRPAITALRLAGLLAEGGRLICTGPGERSGEVRVARAERRTGLGWGTVCAHTAGRLTVEALDALTANHRTQALPLAVRAAADAFRLDLRWIEAPLAKQTLAVLDRVPAPDHAPTLIPGLPILPESRQPTGRERAATGS